MSQSFANNLIKALRKAGSVLGIYFFEISQFFAQGYPSFLPINLAFIRQGRGIEEWFEELSWDKSWQNLLGGERSWPKTEAFVVSWHYVDPQEMAQLYVNRLTIDNAIK